MNNTRDQETGQSGESVANVSTCSEHFVCWPQRSAGPKTNNYPCSQSSLGAMGPAYLRVQRMWFFAGNCEKHHFRNKLIHVLEERQSCENCHPLFLTALFFFFFFSADISSLSQSTAQSEDFFLWGSRTWSVFASSRSHHLLSQFITDCKHNIFFKRKKKANCVCM